MTFARRVQATHAQVHAYTPEGVHPSVKPRTLDVVEILWPASGIRRYSARALDPEPST